jgi:hypothetical protein
MAGKRPGPEGGAHHGPGAGCRDFAAGVRAQEVLAPYSSAVIAWLVRAIQRRDVHRAKELSHALDSA